MQRLCFFLPSLHRPSSRTRNKDLSPNSLPVHRHYYPHPAKKPYVCPSPPFENLDTTPQLYIPICSAPLSRYSSARIPAPRAPAGTQSTLDSVSGMPRDSVAPSSRKRRWWKLWRRSRGQEYKLLLRAVRQKMKWIEG